MSVQNPNEECVPQCDASGPGFTVTTVRGDFKRYLLTVRNRLNTQLEVLDADVGDFGGLKGITIAFLRDAINRLEDIR
jgi:hypothetical protein